MKRRAWPLVWAGLALAAWTHGTAGGQLPSLFAGYSFRPTAGTVAGVDFYVGLPVGTSLTPWYSASYPSGVTVNTTSGLVACNSGSGTVTLSGIDFAAVDAATGRNGGYVAVSNSQTCPTLILNNDLFGCSTLVGSDNYFIQLQSTSSVALTVTNSTATGDGCEIGQTAQINTASSGSVTLKNNFFQDLQGGQLIQFAAGSGATVAVDIEYNLIYFQNGFTSAYPSSHMNFQQFNGGTVTADTWSGNTVAVLGYPFAVAGEGPQFYGNVPPFTITNPFLQNNTFVGYYGGVNTCMGPCPSISNAVHGSLGTAGTTCSGTGTDTGNWFSWKSSGATDGTQGMYGAYHGGTMNGGCWTNSGNKSLLDNSDVEPGA